MSLIRRMYIKAYYYNLYRGLSETEHPANYRTDQRNIFIYFDYEREFGAGFDCISDQQVFKILDLLDAHNLKATWFTVGRIFQAYPDSIRQIYEHGHAIGSHTWNHIVPFHTKHSAVSNDFNDFEKYKPEGIPVRGFHAPQGMWSRSSLNALFRHNYNYQLTGLRKNETFRPGFFRNKAGKMIYRMVTAGDDWPLYQKNADSQEVEDYFLSLIHKIPTGGIGGIGFHPWVIYSNPAFLVGFRKFLSYISDNKNLNIQRSDEYIMN